MFLQSLKSLSGFVVNEDIYNKYLKDKIDASFIDHLFDVQENYVDDLEVGREMNNILCNLCLRSGTLASQISNLIFLIFS